MKILVTGSTGFIGQHIVQSLLEHEHDVSVLVRDKSKVTWPEVNVVEATEGWSDALMNHSFDGVIHLASCFLAQHKHDEIENLIQSNIEFPTKLLDALAGKAKWWLNIGTFWQHYENAEYSPVNLYAATKQSFESVAQFYVETTDINFLNLKISDTFGPGDTRRKLFTIWKELLEDNESLGMSPGDQEINILHVDDVCRGVMHAMNLLADAPKGSIKNQSYGLSSEKPLSLKELANAFSKVAGKELNINWGGRDYRPREVMKTWSNFTPLPGWKPELSIQEGIKAYLESN